MLASSGRSDELTSVFERGFQAQQPPEARSDGFGFSLEIARRSAELMGGEVWAESSGLGRGASFNLALPLAD